MLAMAIWKMSCSQLHSVLSAIMAKKYLLLANFQLVAIFVGFYFLLRLTK